MFDTLNKEQNLSGECSEKGLADRRREERDFKSRGVTT